jgi:hypothetical protein
VINLCQDQYGNYVIQHLLNHRLGQKCKEIYKALKGRILEMSMHKFASNVIERCLHFGTKEQKDDIINEIIAPKGDNKHDPLVTLVKDKFGNYVIQKIIEYAEPEQKEKIIQKILSTDIAKKKDNYSKHVISFIERMGYNVNNGQKKQNNNSNNNNLNENQSGNNNMMNDININNFQNMNMNNYGGNLFNNNEPNLNQVNMDEINNVNFNNIMENYQLNMHDYNNNQDGNDI